MKTALEVLQAARSQVLNQTPFNRGAYWILCSAIDHLIGGQHTSTVTIFRGGSLQ